MARHVSHRTVTATELRRNLSGILRRLQRRREHAVIQSSGAPVAVILSAPEYEDLVARQRRDEAKAAFQDFARHLGEEVERRGITEEELLADLEKTKREVFEERYGKLN